MAVFRCHASFRRKPLRPLAGALAASACLHALLAITAPQPGLDSYETAYGLVPITARLVRQPPALDGAPRHDVAPERAPSPAMPGEAAESAPDAQPDSGPTPPPRREEPVPKIYEAAELDVLPRPARALALRWPAPGNEDRAAPVIRFELVIDRRGVVTSISRPGRARGDRADAAIEAALAATRFVPARKDGRAVASRLTIQVTAAR